MLCDEIRLQFHYGVFDASAGQVLRRLLGRALVLALWRRRLIVAFDSVEAGLSPDVAHHWLVASLTLKSVRHRVISMRSWTTATSAVVMALPLRRTFRVA